MNLGTPRWACSALSHTRARSCRSSAVWATLFNSSVLFTGFPPR
jgi:hypothetical protein